MVIKRLMAKLLVGKMGLMLLLLLMPAATGGEVLMVQMILSGLQEISDLKLG